MCLEIGCRHPSHEPTKHSSNLISATDTANAVNSDSAGAPGAELSVATSFLLSKGPLEMSVSPHQMPSRPPLWGVWSDRATEEHWLASADRRLSEWAAGRAAGTTGVDIPLPARDTIANTAGTAAEVPAVSPEATMKTAQTSALGATPELSPNTKPIPKIVHHIWLGSPLPARAAAMRATWEKHHSQSNGWRFILWDDAAVAQVLAESRKPLPRKSSSSKAAASAATAQTTSAAATATATAAASPQQPASTSPADSLARKNEILPASSVDAAKATPPVNKPSHPSVRIANLAAYDAATNWGEKSDVLRYEILSQVSNVI